MALSHETECLYQCVAVQFYNTVLLGLHPSNTHTHLRHCRSSPETAEMFKSMVVYDDDDDVAYVHRHFSLTGQAQGLRQAA